LTPARGKRVAVSTLVLPRTAGPVVVKVAPGREVRLTNLNKPFWPALGITKGDLLQYYADVAPALLPICATGRW